jgi:hypothetical protein
MKFNEIINWVVEIFLIIFSGGLIYISLTEKEIFEKESYYFGYTLIFISLISMLFSYVIGNQRREHQLIEELLEKQKEVI